MPALFVSALVPSLNCKKKGMVHVWMGQGSHMVQDACMGQDYLRACGDASTGCIVGLSPH